MKFLTDYKSPIYGIPNKTKLKEIISENNGKIPYSYIDKNNDNYEEYEDIIIKIIDNYNQGNYTLDDLNEVRNYLRKYSSIILKISKDIILTTLELNEKEKLKIIKEFLTIEENEITIDQINPNIIFDIIKKIGCIIDTITKQYVAEIDESELKEIYQSKDKKQTIVNTIKDRFKERTIGIDSISYFKEYLKTLEDKISILLNEALRSKIIIIDNLKILDVERNYLEYRHLSYRKGGK